MNSKITISGNIISELSEKIPSNIIALNELIKNAYDAGAPNVEVILDSEQKKLTILDKGEGMNKSDIDTLFHISNSNKVYGSFNEKYGRYVQGSKGLGFLSVFKFGHKVQWETKKDKGYRFCLDYENMRKQYNLSEMEIELIEDDSIEKGTRIEISLDDYNNNSLLEYFNEEKNQRKIINAFDDKNFEIILKINNITYAQKTDEEVMKIVPNKRLYYITYDSENEKIEFYYNNHCIIEKNFSLSSSKYKLSLELVIFQLPPHGKNKIDKLYFNNANDLSPLIYVNSNLFNNFDLFDPNIMKNIKTDLVLNQMIGRVKIISADEGISFNSDRSQFLQNELTDTIRSDLYKINKLIQTEGSQHKKYLKEFNILTVKKLPYECEQYTDIEKFRKFVCSDFKFRNLVEIKRKGNKVSFSLWGKTAIANICSRTNDDGENSNTQSGGHKDMPAIIQLTTDDKIEIGIPSDQIDLYSYIKTVRNSKGEEVNKSFVKIQIDNEEASNILPSITGERTINVEYLFHDEKTGLVLKRLILVFTIDKSTFSTENMHTKLITIPSKQNYILNFNVYVSLIVDQVNKLDTKLYKEVIACSLRSLFEISVDTIAKSAKFPNFFEDERDLAKRVGMVITYIKDNNKYQSEIAKATLIDFHSLKNMLDKDNYESGVYKAHLGAHKSMTYISEKDIDDLGNLIGLFLVLVNEMLKNSNIQ